MLERWLPGLIAQLRPGGSVTYTNALQFFITTGLCVVVLIIAIVAAYRLARPKQDSSARDAVRAEFEKTKEALLLAAQAKKAAHEADESARRQAEVEEKEKELLRENVNPELVLGQNCPLCGLEMAADQELVIDPYTGQAYHFSSFLNDWPAGAPRPKYVYRYPQGAVVKSADLVREF